MVLDLLFSVGDTVFSMVEDLINGEGPVARVVLGLWEKLLDALAKMGGQLGGSAADGTTWMKEIVQGMGQVDLKLLFDELPSGGPLLDFGIRILGKWQA